MIYISKTRVRWVSGWVDRLIDFFQKDLFKRRMCMGSRDKIIMFSSQQNHLFHYCLNEKVTEKCWFLLEMIYGCLFFSAQGHCNLTKHFYTRMDLVK